MSNTYRALAALISYPTPELQAATAEIAGVLDAEGMVVSTRLDALLADIAAADIYDLQERYVGLFDRSRALSLHLFEHVHGESRDRGQAMADLLQLYDTHGMEMAPGELPDYLPAFLEFLSLCPEDEARILLAEPAGILRALADRLQTRGSVYAPVLEALADIAAAPPVAVSDIDEADPDDLEALDADWAEAEVRFGPGEAMDGCGTDRLRTRMRAAARDVERSVP